MIKINREIREISRDVPIQIVDYKWAFHYVWELTGGTITCKYPDGLFGYVEGLGLVCDEDGKLIYHWSEILLRAIFNDAEKLWVKVYE